MTRFEVNFLLFLACAICANTSDGALGKVPFYLLGLWHAARAMFPTLDRLAMGERPVSSGESRE